MLAIEVVEVRCFRQIERQDLREGLVAYQEMEVSIFALVRLAATQEQLGETRYPRYCDDSWIPG